MLPNKSTLEIFRDCLRLVPKMVQEPKKVVAVRRLVKLEFSKNRHEKNPEKIQQLRFNAIRGISNYLLLTVKEEYQKNPNNSQFFDESDDDADISQETQLQELKPSQKP